jgi:hypothetical protein
MKVYVLIDKHGVARKAYVSAGHVTLKLQNNRGKYTVVTVPFEVESVQTEEEWLSSPDRKIGPRVARRT